MIIKEFYELYNEEEFETMCTVNEEAREYFMVVGYWRDYLVALDEMDRLFVCKEEDRLFEPGTVCDKDMELVPADCLPEPLYTEFVNEFCKER